MTTTAKQRCFSMTDLGKATRIILQIWDSIIINIVLRLSE